MLPGSGAPAVVAVVVTTDPGDWFEAVLDSLEAQDYEELSVLVVDNGSEVDPTPRVADVAPGAFVKRLEAAQGFSEAANEALRSVEGAPFLLFCHDDVRLAPDAVTQLVAEAFRANAGIVGAKLVDWDDPTVLRSVGLGVDSYGASTSLVDPGELDQQQHDIARGVFAVSDACMLVRADLFTTLGGFRAEIPFFGEDVDLCWRTQVAGATVQFCPKAVAAHRDAFEARSPDTACSRLAARHQTRSMLTNYELRSLVRLVPAGILLSALELVGSLFTGRTARAGDVLSAWAWGLTHPLEVIRGRRDVNGYRRVRDVSYLPLMLRGSIRLRTLFRRDDGESRLVAATRSSRERWRSVTASDSRLGTAVAVAVPLVVVFGARSLWFGALPSMREFTDAGSSVGTVLSEWFTGWRAPGLGEAAIAPGAVPGLGLAGTVLVGSLGAARRILLLAPVLLGPLGAWRLFAGARSVRTRAAAVTAYALSPILLNALGEARLQATVAAAAAPWVLARLGRHGGLLPLVGGESTERAPDAPSLVATVLLVAVVAAFSPLAAVVAVVAAVCVLVGPGLTGQGQGALRGVAAGGLALAGAAALNLPWLVAALRHGDAASLTGLWVGRGGVPSAGEMLTGSVGDLRTGWWGWGLVVAAAVPLVTGRRWRFGWALGGWLAVLAGLCAAVLAVRADLVAGAGLELFLVPVVLGLTVAVAMAPLAFETDVVRADFGFPQVASFTGLAALVLALVPVLVAATDGRWYLPAGDFGPALEAVDGGDDFRTLWIGDPDLLPLSAWVLDGVEAVGFGTSEGMAPTMSQRWRLDGGAPVHVVGDALRAAVEGRTVRLGRALAPMSIRYVVVVDRPAPEPFAGVEVPAPAGVIDALEEQLDLLRVPIGPGVDLFEVAGAWPPRADVAGRGVPTDRPEGTGATAVVEGAVPEAVLGSGFGTSFEGTLDAGAQVAQSVTGDPGWHLAVDGREAERGDLLGWGQQFSVPDSGAASLSWSTPTSSRLLQAWQLLALLVALVAVFRRGRSRGPTRRRRGRSTAEPIVVLDGETVALQDWRERPGGSEDRGQGGSG